MKVVLRSVITIIYIVLLLIVLQTSTFAQPPEIQWTKTFGDSLDDLGYSVKQTSDGSYVVTGATNINTGSPDLLLFKTGSNGETLWSKTFGDTGCVGNMGFSIYQTTDDGYIITGISLIGCGNGGGWSDGGARLIKTNIDGDSLWSKDYKSSVSRHAWGNSVQQTLDSGYIFTGVSGRGFGGWGLSSSLGVIWLVKTDSDGDTIWTKSFGNEGDLNNSGNSVQQTKDGGFVITGSKWSSNTNSLELLLLKTDANGETLWSKTYGDSSSEDCGYSVQETTDGGYIIAGTGSFGLIKTDMNGDTLWTRSHGGFSIQECTDGGYIIVGNNNNDEMLVIKTFADGNILWTKTLEGTGKVVQQTSDDGYIICGSRNGDVLLVKIAPDINSIDENPLVYLNDYQLQQNYPNPFNPSTTIEFSLLKSEFVELKVFNVLGKEVSTLVSNNLNQGNYTYSFDGRDLASGVYYYRLVAGDYREVKKMIRLK